MTTLATDLLRDEAMLPALAAAWAALWRRTRASPFQHPAWLLPWWAQFGAGAPRVAVLREGDRLLGLLALYDLASERKVLPMGAGITDYQDALIDPGAPPGASEALLRAALAGCDLPCHLTDLPPGASLRAARAPAGWTASQHDSDPCPVLRPQDVPARQRRKLRMSRHRADRIGGSEVYGAVLFSDLVRLHEQRWRGSGVLADPRVRAFHAAALPHLAEAGLLLLRGLRLGHATAAVIYALQSPGRVFFYLSGFDAAHSFESPGTILLGAMIDEAADAGATELHFLRGAEPYKYAWGAVDRYNATRILEPP